MASANDVVSSIAKLVDTIRATHSAITSVVIVGADDQIPFARLADGATQSNERDYAASTFPGEENVLANTLGQGYFLSDDPYTATQPLAVGSATLYTPKVAVGRLVETPQQIDTSLQRFLTYKGVLDAKAALSTGYSFLTGGAEAVAANLAKVTGRTVAQLINETWTHADLDQALTATPAPGLDSINAHFDYGRALPAIGNTTGKQTDLFTTTDVADAPHRHLRRAAAVLHGVPRRPGARRPRVGGERLCDTDRRLGQDLRQRRGTVGGQHRVRLRRHIDHRLLGQAHGGLRRQPERDDEHRCGPHQRQADIQASNTVLARTTSRPSWSHLLRSADVPPELRPAPLSPPQRNPRDRQPTPTHTPAWPPPP